LGTTDVTIGDIIRLGVGDVVPLSTFVESELDVLVGDRQKFKGRPGTIRNKMALQITDVIDDQEWEDE
ncbi:MAG: FliM/FliN family flagellar motor switch protein, partial [Candidatus Sericytochromatia bacterium]